MMPEVIRLVRRAEGDPSRRSLQLWLHVSAQDPSFVSGDAQLANALHIHLHVWQSGHDFGYWNALERLPALLRTGPPDLPVAGPTLIAMGTTGLPIGVIPARPVQTTFRQIRSSVGPCLVLKRRPSVSSAVLPDSVGNRARRIGNVGTTAEKNREPRVKAVNRDDRA
jgi:hypothetical protein